jgi:pimeloyl-ACP methyl ester carboxylesterase
MNASSLLHRRVGQAAVGTLVVLAAALPAHAQSTGLDLKPCRLPEVEHGALCGVLKRPLDPAQPTGRQIDLHVAVLPALARNKREDPVFFLAGGPGQSAIDLAGPVARMLGRFLNRRDLVLIDQRGTGKSAPLVCDTRAEPTRPIGDSSTAAMLARLAECRTRLEALPHGDLRQYTTTIAMQDADAVRAALGAERINVVGGSYGTRAALEYMRQFPQRVRRAVIDGVAPPDMTLPAAFSRDGQAALDAMFAACEKDSTCASRWPTLRADWRALLARLPMPVTVQHPVTGVTERLTMDRDLLLGLVRGPLYAPPLASGLPAALDAAARGGRYEPLVGLMASMLGNRGLRLAEGMHISVVCSEDLPRLDAGQGDAPGADTAEVYSNLYRNACRGWPRGNVPAAFYEMPKAPFATLVMSGGADPATPPRHGTRTVQALGANARHLVVAEAGHGLLGVGCLRDTVFRFVDAPTEAEALAVPLDCAQAMPRPPAQVPVGGAPPAAPGAMASSAKGGRP